jgi:SAM-dependent methyltransferase
MNESTGFYRDDLALVHHLGFGFHGDRCAPGILAALAPIRDRNGLVLELGCGGGHLTRHLLKAGHRVIATDASPSMLAIAREVARDAEGIRQIALPDDPLPEADAIVAIGHVFNYLRDEAAIHRALVSASRALRPGGVLAIDMQDLEWGEAFRNAPGQARVADDWALISEFSVPEPGLKAKSLGPHASSVLGWHSTCLKPLNSSKQQAMSLGSQASSTCLPTLPSALVPEPARFVRRHISFIRAEDGTWRRDEEVHVNVLVDTATIPAILSEHGLSASVADSFGDEELPRGLVAVIGEKVD